MRRIRTVLVIDDDPASLHQIALQLDEAGFNVKSLSSAHEALCYLREPGRPPDIILVDLWMPGIHGVALAQTLKSDPALHAIPLCAITGYAYSEADVRLATGVEGFLHKPLPWGDELRATLFALIDQARGARAPFIPLRQAAERLGLSVAEARRHLYVVTVAHEPAVRSADVERLEDLQTIGDNLAYARALRHAFDRSPWRELNWKAKAAHFNKGLPTEMHLTHRALQRITLGQDKELLRVIRMLAAFERKLGVRVQDLYAAVVPEGEEETEEK